MAGGEIITFDLTFGRTIDNNSLLICSVLIDVFFTDQNVSASATKIIVCYHVWVKKCKEKLHCYKHLHRFWHLFPLLRVLCSHDMCEFEMITLCFWCLCSYTKIKSSTWEHYLSSSLLIITAVPLMNLEVNHGLFRCEKTIYLFRSRCIQISNNS